MDTEIRIPTLLGLGILLVGIVIGVLLVIQNQNLSTKASTSNFPKEITVTNITATSASISWKTDAPVPGFIQVGPQPALGLTFRDIRDQSQPEPHQLHFVTLDELTPNTKYYYQVNSGSDTYPETPASFTTANEIPNQNYSPLIGIVLDVNSQPVSEALVTLSIDGAQPISTVTSGSFLLPLATLRTSDLSKGFLLENTAAQITVVSGDKVSRGTVTLPFKDISLPPITLGEDFAATPAAVPVKINPFDLNGDSQVNTADLSQVISNAGKNPKNPKADLNDDGTVDQRDLDLIRKEINANQQR